MLGNRLGLAGALEARDGDYFMLVDASVNSTKLNIVLDQRIDLTIGLDAQGNAEHEATVTYRNNLPIWAQGRDPQLVRRLMLDGLYGGYVRLLVPPGSQSGRDEIPGGAVDEGHAQAFGDVPDLRFRRCHLDKTLKALGWNHPRQTFHNLHMGPAVFPWQNQAGGRQLSGRDLSFR
jgi:hypothetical protein